MGRVGRGRRRWHTWHHGAMLRRGSWVDGMSRGWRTAGLPGRWAEVGLLGWQHVLPSPSPHTSVDSIQRFGSLRAVPRASRFRLRTSEAACVSRGGGAGLLSPWFLVMRHGGGWRAEDDHGCRGGYLRPACDEDRELYARMQWVVGVHGGWCSGLWRLIGVLRGQKRYVEGTLWF